MGGILAGQAIAECLESGEASRLRRYQTRWNKKFGREFERQLLARRMLERMDNGTIDRIFDSVTPEIAAEISEHDDFDFHTSSIVRIMGLKGSLKTANALIGGEIRRLFR